MFKKFIEWLAKKLGIIAPMIDKQVIENAMYASNYRDISNYTNPTADIADSLTDLTMVDSTAEVTEDNERAIILNEMFQMAWKDLRKPVASAFGEGGTIIRQTIYNNKIYPSFLPQEAYVPLETIAGIVKKAALIIGSYIKDNRKYILWEIHSIENGDQYKQWYEAVDDTGKSVPLSINPEWEALPVLPEFVYDKMLFGHIKCPKDNRDLYNNVMGVPITYGQQELITMRNYFISWLNDEMELKRVIVGADSTLFGADGTIAGQRTAAKNVECDKRLSKLFVMLNGDSGKDFFTVYDPQLRVDAVITAIDKIDRIIEQGTGTSRGILTDLDLTQATNPAVKRATFSTFSKVKAMQKNIESALQNYIDGCNAWLNMSLAAENRTYAKTVDMDYTLSFSWSYALLQDDTEEFNNKLKLASAGLLKGEYVTAFEMAVSPEEALKNYMPDVTENVETEQVPRG